MDVPPNYKSPDSHVPLFSPFPFNSSLNGNRKIQGNARKTSTISKKTLEKLRRERMNEWIRRLKDLILRHLNEKERLIRSKKNQLWALHHKWEKADVIELGVELLEETIQYFNKNDENIEWKGAKSPSPLFSSLSLPPSIPSIEHPLIRTTNQCEIWRPF